MSILIVGASGFIGQAVVTSEEFSDYSFTCASLRKTSVSAIDFNNITSVFYCAGVTQVKKSESKDLLTKVNCTLAEQLAKRAKDSGVGYFLYLSSTKIFGDDPTIEVYYPETDPQPTDDYGRSKQAGEKALSSLSDNSFKVCIIRPAAVYGENAKGNLLSLVKLIEKGFPLPFKGIDNKRSMIYLGNLVSLMSNLYKNKTSGVFTAVDLSTVSTSHIANTIKKELGVDTPYFQAPTILLTLLKKIKGAVHHKLFGSQYYVVDAKYNLINFIPPYTFEQGVKNMVQQYLKTKDDR